MRFVPNRVSFIRCNSEVSQWNYVPSSENPADCISRGVSIPQFLKLSSLMKEPKFLWEPKENSSNTLTAESETELPKKMLNRE